MDILRINYKRRAEAKEIAQWVRYLPYWRLSLYLQCPCKQWVGGLHLVSAGSRDRQSPGLASQPTWLKLEAPGSTRSWGLREENIQHQPLPCTYVHMHMHHTGRKLKLKNERKNFLAITIPMLERFSVVLSKRIFQRFLCSIYHFF